MQNERPSDPWYLRMPAIVAAILLIGPFALPLVWMSRSLTRTQKWAVTAGLALFSAWLLTGGAEIYRVLERELADLREVMK